LHKFFAYAKCLLRKLPYEDGERVDLEDEVVLQYYRVQKIFEGSIAFILLLIQFYRGEASI
jgi:type I restriction enzyme R subunit